MRDKIQAQIISLRYYDSYTNREGRQVPAGLIIEFGVPYDSKANEKGKYGLEVHSFNCNKQKDPKELFEQIKDKLPLVVNVIYEQTSLNYPPEFIDIELIK